MLIELAIVTAAASVAGLLALRRARRARKAAQPPPEPVAAPPAPAEALAISLGAVVQCEGMSRWLRARIALSDEGQIHSALLLAYESGAELAVMVFALPERDILWLERITLALPPSPPTRLEIDGCLFDRRALLPLDARADGKDAPALEGSVLLAVYDGAESRSAVVLSCAGDTRVYHGLRVGPDDWDVLGRVDPTSDEIGTS